MSGTDRPIRLLQINSGNRQFGGISSFLYNLYTHIDVSRVQFDFLFPYFSTFDAYSGRIEAKGGHVYQLGISGNTLRGKLELYSKVRRFLKGKAYPIVHINSGNLVFNTVVSRAVRDAGIEHVIVHSHNTENPSKSALRARIKQAMKSVLARQATEKYACSRAAAGFMFPEAARRGEVSVIHNGLEVNRFAYDEAARRETRALLGVQEGHVVGHVGMFNAQKNQAFLVKAFAKVARADPRAVLVLVGEGENQANVKALVDRLDLSDKVILTGLCRDIERYYQAFDVFAFPSVWEGFGMVMVEAQISGLPCIASTRVSTETDITGNVQYLDISEASLDAWASAILDAFRYEGRENRVMDAVAAGYDIDTVAEDLTGRYQRMVNRA